MDNGNIVIQANDIESAQMICGSIQDADKRNRAVANVLAAKIASGFFNKDLYDVDVESGLHNFARVLNDIDISDIYVNDSYVDVRVYFSEDEICVPKIHFDYGITPVAYMFIKLNRNLSEGTVTGFILPDNVNQDYLKDGYYYIKEENFASFYDIENHFQKVLDTYDGSNEKMYEYVDGVLNTNDTIQLFRTLLTSKMARKSLMNIAKAQSIFNFVSVPNESYVENEDVQDGAEQVEEVQEVNDPDLLYQALEYSTEVTPQNSEMIGEEDIVPEDINVSDEEEQIDALFTGEQEGVPAEKKKKSSLMPLLVMLLIVAAGYFGYMYIYPMYSSNNMQNSYNEQSQEELAPAQNVEESGVKESQGPEAMPNEQVETSQIEENTEEGTQVAIPAIEKNLDASVLVSNLKVDWEVPEGYISNTAAKYYFVKLGKMIQLNLKTELLLLTKPPLSNRIAIELHYNPNFAKFEVVGFKTSSGESSVDDVIMNSVKSSLDMKIGANAESFAKAQGNPVIVIHL